MIYRITYDNKNRKVAHPVRNREELMALRDSKKNLEKLAKARQGDEKAKADLLPKVMRKPKQTFCNWPIIWVM